MLERHAEEDLTERAAYIARENPAVAQAFLDAVERAFTRLADMPGIGSPFGSYRNLHFLLPPYQELGVGSANQHVWERTR